MIRPRFTPLLAALLLGCCGPLLAASKYALTLYDKSPKYPADFKHFDYVNPDAPKDGILRQADFGGFDSLNPFIGKGVSAPSLGLIYDTLAFQSQDEPFIEYGLLAEKIEGAPDNSYVRFYLRPQVRFSNGTPVTAEDVVFTFETPVSKGDSMYRSYYADVDKAVAEDKLHVCFDFKHTGNRELPLILSQIAVLSKYWWADRDFSKTDMEIPVGSGPYRIAKVDPGRSISYERVKGQWTKDLPASCGLYNFDTITIDSYHDMSIALEAFKAGQYDVNLEYSAKDWATGYESPALRDGRFIKAGIHNHNSVGMQSFAFNIRRPVFQDRRVRQAINLLFDFEWSNKQLFFSSYKCTNSYFENSEMAAHQLPSEAELKIFEPLRGKISDRAFDQVFQNPVNDSSGVIHERRRRAYQLPTEAGYRVENNRVVGPDGQPLSFEFMLFQTNMERVILPFKRNLAELDIDMQIRRVGVSQSVNRLRSQDFDMTSATWPQSNSPGSEQREFWYSSSADRADNRNFIGLKDPAIDSLVGSLIQSDSRQSLIDHTRVLDRVLSQGYYAVPNYYADTWRVVYWDRFGRPKVTPLCDWGLMTWQQTGDKTPPSKTQAEAA